MGDELFACAVNKHITLDNVWTRYYCSGRQTNDTERKREKDRKATESVEGGRDAGQVQKGLQMSWPGI